MKRLLITMLLFTVSAKAQSPNLNGVIKQSKKLGIQEAIVFLEAEEKKMIHDNVIDTAIMYDVVVDRLIKKYILNK